jgi:hypothetical protein
MSDYNSLQKSVIECFGEKSVQKAWSEDGKIWIAITEDENWSQNKCVLKNWFFDYDKFKTLNLQMDCDSYGVYVFWR